MAKKAARATKKREPAPSLSKRWRALLEQEKKLLNKRIFARAATYQFARIGVEAGAELDCVVRDMSEGGVRIKMEEARRLPAAVRITFVDSGQTKLCRVAWQKSKHAGLEYLGQKRRAYKALDD